MPTKPTLPLTFPVLGLHEGVGYDIQPPGTTADALNVRGIDALKNRLRGGRRSGLSKWHGSQVFGDTPIQRMTAVTQAVAPTGTPVVVADDITSYTTASSANFLGNWVPVSRRFTTSSVGVPAASAVNVVAGPPKRIQILSTSSSGDNVSRFLMSRYQTTGTMECEFYAAPQSDTATSTDLVNQCGIMFRAGAGHGRYMFVAFSQVTATSVALRLFSADGATLTTVSTLDTYVLSGGATPKSGMVIRVGWTADTITVYVQWDATETAADAKWAGTTYTIANTTFGTDVDAWHAGPHILGTVSVVTFTRSVVRMSYTKIVPPTSTVLYQLRDTDDDVSLANRYELPNAWSNYRTSGTVLSNQNAGPISFAATTNFAPRIDTTNDRLDGGTSSTGTTRDVIVRTTPEATQVISEFRFAGDGRATQSITVVMGLAVSRFQYLALTVTTAPNAAADSYKVAQISLAQLLLCNAATDTSRVLHNTSTTTPGLPIVSTDTSNPTWIRVVYDGNSVKMTINGAIYFSYQLQASDTSAVGSNFQSGFSLSAMTHVRMVGTVSAGAVSRRPLVVCSNGSIATLEFDVKTVPAGGEGCVEDDLHAIQMQSAYQDVFIVDGRQAKVYRLATDDVVTWAATVGTAPTLARLICLYRGRVVTSGVVNDPNNWFMSKSGDPYDYDYSPATPNSLQAVAGNNSSAGLVGDVITALIPISDDVMYFGGDSSIYMMTGDPASGGVIDLVSETGILFGRAWAKDPSGTLYFAGVDGIYRMSPNTGPPQNLSNGRLERRFRAVDNSNTRVYLEWDYLRSGLIVNIVPLLEGSASEVYFWDSRVGDQGAWWPEQYPASMGPSVVYAYDGSRPEDQALLVGCYDGYIRQLDDAALDDDGTLIQSHVRFPMFLAPDHTGEVILTDIIPVMGATSSVANVNIYTGQTAEDCVLATAPRVSRVLTRAGRSESIRQRVRGYAVQVGISGTGLWALEGLTCGFDLSGRPRREARP